MRKCLAAFVVAIACGTAGGEERGDFARAEVRGTLAEWRFRYPGRDEPEYAVTVGEGREATTYVLELAGDLKKAAKGLVGDKVIVTGDLRVVQIGNGAPVERKIAVGKVAVRGLEKAPE